jgi:hypothetical protein
VGWDLDVYLIVSLLYKGDVLVQLSLGRLQLHQVFSLLRLPISSKFVYDSLQ